ncbi:MAG TPA: CHAT domain-containing protein, partial [Chroococcidiopsis sp.]
VYNWLIQPIRDELEQSSIQTLVFVLDGALRSVPMSVLYDGESYLIERYSIALTPGLQLLEGSSLRDRPLEVLLGGVSEPNLGAAALPGVLDEISKIQAALPGRVLLNQSFTSEALHDAVNATAYPIVHLATHGFFSSNLDDTYILTWGDRLTLNEFNDLIKTSDINRRRPIELLVLSACVTAVEDGDGRALLGLAGMAVRAGARSTIASLWQANDVATAQLMTQFYSELAAHSVTKAEALRRAQVALIQSPDFNQPFFWSLFVLVGNWL